MICHGFGKLMEAVSARKNVATNGVATLFWRRKRDLNPRDAHAPYSLSRGAPSASWVFLHRVIQMAERMGFEPMWGCPQTVFKTASL